ncbi:unnamed protein product, partial [Heterotrigona itama]
VTISSVMSSSGYRGRSFGPRGARTNGPPNGFNGPRFSHPTFNHPRPSHRLPGPKFVPWQQNKNFHPQFRGNLQYRPNSRGRATGGRRIVRFSVSGRPPLSQFRFIRNPVHTAPTLAHEEQVEDKSVLAPQTPLLGSEEERQQKIAETADKLKKKLSSITEKELTNCWEDDLSVLPNVEEEDIRNRGIPELRHEPPELDLTFTDFRDIGRIDCNNLKYGNLDSKLSNKISITFDKKLEDNVTSTNNEIIIIDESREEPLIILDLCDEDDLKQSNVSVKDDKCQEQIHCESPDFDCNVENLQLQSITGNLTFSNVNDVDEKLSTLNVDENICTNLSPTESVDNSLLEKVSDVNDIKTASTSVLTTNNQDELKIDFSQDQNTVQADIQDQNSDIAQDTDVNIKQNDHIETKLLEDDQIENDSETNVPQEVIHQNLKNVSEEIHLNIVCDPTSSTHLNYSEVNNKLSDDRKLNNPVAFQSKVFNESPRFTSRTGRPRCHWTFQQNVTNSFFRGAQRLSFHHGNRMSLPKHVTTDLVSVGFDPRTLPPFTHNVPISSHDTQHNSIVPFSSNDQLPTFDPSEPLPNIKSKPCTESLNKQESLQQSMPLANVSQSTSKITESSSTFDHRGPPSIRIPYVSVTIDEQIPEFNPQQPPPKIHKRKETLLPPPVFDPRLSSQERSNLIVPLDASRSNAMPSNLMETSSVPDFSISPVTPNFPRLNSFINTPSHRPLMSNVQMNFPSVVSETSGGQRTMRKFSLRLPPMTITEVPPPSLKEPSSSVKRNSNANQGMTMDDGLEDMQEAMKFAKQMNLTEEVKNKDTPVPESTELTPAEIPVPVKIADGSLTIEERNANNAKKQRRKETQTMRRNKGGERDKRNRQNVVACGLELPGSEKEEDMETTDKGQSAESQSKSTEDVLLSNDQARPKVVFNLNSKTKKIHKPEEWRRISLNVPEIRVTSQQSTVRNLNEQRSISRKHHPFESRNNRNQSRSQQKQVKMKRSSDSEQVASGAPTQKKSSNNAQSHCHKSQRDSEKQQENVTARQSQKPREEARKEKALTSESLWKKRIISRFLKMSKNDICNMVNNSSLRKFDIVMEHLVKERKSSLSLELRNVEDEKMKEYDRIEFMNQLNAMLDPSAVVGITDLPTEFIHHLSEVLQLDIPFDALTTESDSVLDGTNVGNQRENLDTQEHNVQQDKLSPRVKEDPNHHYHHHHHHHVDANSSQTRLNSLAGEAESTHKKQQQPLFNEADLDDILSQVAERTRTLSSSSLPAEGIVTVSDVSSIQTVDSNAESTPTKRVANRSSATDLDDIFSAGIVRARQLESNTNVDHPRARKSSSVDRSNSSRRFERYERWNRKAPEDPDTFRNLTKEEWEAKYGSTVEATLPPRRNASSSAENLSSRGARRRHCSLDDSPARRFSVSPLSRVEVVHARNNAADRCVDDASNERMNDKGEKSESSSEESSSSSFSDSDGEEKAVAANVTKLLKVIKEKEKIAKNRSLNETIRDEVAAEIEKEWKEKSKHKESRSRKRERRKKDRLREKRRRDKRRRKRRDSHSSSRSDCGHGDELRLLTEDEIKKEVKDEKRDESQCLRAEKEQQVSTLPSNVEQATSTAGFPAATQRKTKAQLKQMPKPNDQKQMTTEQLAENLKIKSDRPLEVDIDHETARSCDNEQIDTTAPLSVKESSSSCLQSSNEITIVNSTTRAVISNATNDNTITDAVAFDSKKVNKDGNNYRKIDIKAYKERALQRRSKELERGQVKSSHGSSAKSKSNVEPGSSENETKTGKDPRPIKVRSTIAQEGEESDKGVKERISSSQGDRQRELSSRSADIDPSTVVADPARSKSKGQDEHKRREVDDMKGPGGKKIAAGFVSSRRRPNRSMAVDSSKFKNIRSEGDKELKLIKEKTKRRSNEKKRLPSKLEKRKSSTNIIDRRTTPQKRLHVGNNNNNNNNRENVITSSMTRVNNETIVSNQKEKGDDDGNLTSSDSMEKKQASTMSVESTPIESSIKQSDVCNDVSSTDSMNHGHDESIPVEKCTSSAAPSFPDRVARESHQLLSERIDVDIEKHGRRINVKNFKNDEASIGANCVPEASNVDERTSDNRRTARWQQDASGENSRSQVSDKATAPPSGSSSPFKGFLVDNDVYQVSRFCRARVDDQIVGESSQEQGEPNDKSTSESRTGENGGNEREKSSLENVDKYPSVNDDDDGKDGEIENQDQRKFLSVAGIENHDTFIEDSEPFIVLDEYIDEKFNCQPDLHAKAVEQQNETRENERETLPREDDTLPLQLFTDTTNVFPSVSVSNVESNSKTVAESQAEYSQNVTDTAKDTSQKGDTTRRKSIKEGIVVDKKKSLGSALSDGKDRRNRLLNSVRNKPRMKHKKKTRRLKQPTTKEVVMARMIEIDVEIHKLMTEKMTLYQMLTSDKSLQQSNKAEDKNVTAESPVTRPPSSVMSRLLQNMDTAPASHCERERDSTASPNISKTLGKHNHHNHQERERKESCVSVCDSEGEEIGARSSKKKKRQRPERTAKRFESKLDIVEIGKRQASDNNNAMKLTCRREDARRPATIQTSLFPDQFLTKVEADVAGNDTSNKSQTGNDVESAKSRESKTPERLSIYSDDSTWDSFHQNPTIAADDQKKPSTGLALLEETYRREMARARRTRERTRKRKRKLRNMLRNTVNDLTSDEEELPLATLYAKKLHQRRELLDSLEQGTRQQQASDPQLWKNVVEIINAVAENRTSDLYTEGPSTEKILTEATTTVLTSAENLDFQTGQEEQMAPASALKDVDQSPTELATISENNSERNDAKTDEPQATMLPDQSQELPNSEHFQHHFQQDSEITRDLLDTRCNTDEIGLAESSVQQTVASNIVDINRTTILDREDSDSCRFAESSSSNIPNDRNVSNVSEHPEISVEKIDVETKKSQSKDKCINVDENIVALDPVDRQFVTKPTEKTEEKNSDIALESDVIIADETTSKNKADDTELENANESNVQDLLTVNDNGDNHSIGESNRQGKHFVSMREHKEPRKRKDTERSGEENNNQSSSFIESGEAFLSKKLLKRKKGSSKTTVRRSSRYEEPAKRIKVEADTAIPVAKQDEKNFRTQSPCEELENVLVNPKKCRSVQRPAANRKRCTPTLSEMEVAPHESSGESLKGFEKHSKYTMCEMMNCMVRLVDCRHTILKSNVSSNVLRKYGIARVNMHCVNCLQTDALVSSTQSTLTKDSSCESPQNQTSKSMRKIDDAARCATSEQISSANKVKRVTKTAKVDLLPVNDTEERENPDIEVMPVLVNEFVTMDIAENCEKSDIEIVEERVRVIKNEQHSDSELPTTVIDKEDKEQARTQYTVHKGPILDIKVFENSFLAASEDGRIYRYNQASNGILNIYKGHKAAVTCLYVYNVISTDISKEWMFSGSLDGTLRCYNIKTGIQVRDTADIGSPIQCMNEAWGIIFIGTKSGHVLRYHMKTGVIKGDSIQFSDKSVLALKATNEGPRRVLIVASRSQPITIRDAQSGLFLRTICGQKNHTVYSLMRNDNLIYCGTSSTSIPVFDFTNGEQTMQYNAGVGIVCMRLYKQLLFAGCYDGNIYVFDTK